MRLRSDVVAISRGQAPRLERGPGAAFDPDFYQVLCLDFGRILISSFARACQSRPHSIRRIPTTLQVTPQTPVENSLHGAAHLFAA